MPFSATVKLLQRATVAENGMDYDFGPPPVVKPAHEMLGEVYLSLGRADAAVAEFEAALQRAPRRAIALLGLQRALHATGDRARAQTVVDELAAIWSGADEAPPKRSKSCLHWPWR